MQSLEEVRESIPILEVLQGGVKTDKYGKALQTVMDLALSVLDAEGLPKERELGIEIPTQTQGLRCKAIGYNEALSECRAYIAKRELEMEARLNGLENNVVVRDVVSDCLLRGYDSFGNTLNDMCKELATAIKNHLKGEK